MSVIRNSVVGAVLLACAAAGATEGECSLCTQDYTACLTRANGLAYAVQSCQAEEERHQEKSLNAAYSSALRKLSPQRKRELHEVQKLWLRYRSENARFLVAQGLSGNKIESSKSSLALTALRVAELKRMAEDE